MMNRVILILLVLGGFAVAAEHSRNLFKIVRVNESVVGISCPGNHGDPTVITNAEGTLLVSCGTVENDR